MLRIRVLTRADLLSDAALRYQIRRAEKLRDKDRTMYTKDIAVVAMDLGNENIKLKELKPFLEILAGAEKVVEELTAEQTAEIKPAGSIVVCGLPNAGKSSLIRALTKERTLRVRKKKHYHLPKVSQTAGWTLGLKKHTVETKIDNNKGNYQVSLTDTPGLRPRAKSMSPVAGSRFNGSHNGFAG